METWKIIVIALVAIVIIAVVVGVVIYFNKKKETKGQSKSPPEPFAYPLARRERFEKAKSGSLDSFINEYINIENGNWN